MAIKQAFNPKIDAWVKYKFTKKTGFRVLDVKQREPKKPFRGIPINKKKWGDIMKEKNPIKIDMETWETYERNNKKYVQSKTPCGIVKK